jgi:hypothetical protein
MPDVATDPHQAQRLGSTLRVIANASRSIARGLSTNKDLISSLKDIVGVLAIFGAGLWTILLTSQFRDTAPRLATVHQVQSWRLPDKRILVRIQVDVSNVGKVQVAPVNGILFAQPLMPLTIEQRELLASGRLIDDCVKNDGSRVAGCVAQQGIRVNEHDKSLLNLDGKDKSLEPGESNSYWKYMVLSPDTTTIEVYTYIDNPKENGRRGWARDSVVDLKPI